ncbi:MAG: amino-acid N-acetyltransferase [Verrucomicrobiota bacterium]
MQFGDIRGILQYATQFRGKTFVVNVDGLIVAREGFSNLLLDIAVLHSLNIRTVLVHGAGFQIRELAASRGIELSNDDGTGLTDEATLQVSIDAVTRLHGELMQRLTTAGLQAVAGNVVIAKPAGIVNGVDQLMTGTIDRIDVPRLETFLKEGMLPVVGPLGYDQRGQMLRVNSDAVALAIATALKAEKLLFVTGHRITDEEGTRFNIPVAEAEQLAKSERIAASSRLSSIFKFAIAACNEGVSRSHILDGRENEVLLAELFSNEGVGTMIHGDDYDQIREARPEDVPEVMALIQASIANAELAPRTQQEIMDKLDDYALLEIDGNIVGTVAIHFFREENVAELACLFVKRDHEHRGHGRRMVGFAEKRARRLGALKIFALSTQATGFFSNIAGFREAGLDELPPQKLALISEQRRNSLVFVKTL